MHLLDKVYTQYSCIVHQRFFLFHLFYHPQLKNKLKPLIEAQKLFQIFNLNIFYQFQRNKFLKKLLR